MAKVIARNGFTGLRCGIQFFDGIAQTNNVRALEWFRSHGYAVEDRPSEVQAEQPPRKPRTTKPKED